MFSRRIGAYIIAFSLALAPVEGSAVSAPAEDTTVPHSSVVSLLCGVSLLGLCGWGKISVGKKIVDGKAELFDIEFPLPSAKKRVREQAVVEKEMVRWRQIYALSTIGSLAGVVCVGVGFATIVKSMIDANTKKIQGTVRLVEKYDTFFSGWEKEAVAKISTTPYTGMAKELVEYFNQLQDHYIAHKKKVRFYFDRGSMTYSRYRPEHYGHWTNNGMLLEKPPERFDNVLYLTDADLQGGDDDLLIAKVAHFRYKCLNYMMNCARAGAAAHERRRIDKALYPDQKTALEFAIAHNELDRIFYNHVITGLDALRNRWRKNKMRDKMPDLSEPQLDDMITLLDKVTQRAEIIIVHDLRKKEGGNGTRNWLNGVQLTYPQVTDVEEKSHAKLLEKTKAEIKILIQKVGTQALQCVKDIFALESRERLKFQYLQWAYQKGYTAYSNKYEKEMKSVNDWLNAGFEDIRQPE